MNKLIRHCVLVLVLALLPATVFAHGADTDAATQAPSGPSLGARAAFGAGGGLWVVDVDNGHVQVRRSDDFGRHFDAPRVVNETPQSIADFSENTPQIALGLQGQIYVAWVQNLPERWASYIWFSRSVDGGKHFSKPILVHRDRAHITHSFPTLIVDGKGQPVVAWIDARDHVAAMKKYGMKGPHAYKGLAIYYAWSPDHGQHFVPAYKVMDHSCECCRIALARAADGHVGAFFRGVYGDNIRDHALALLPTNGQAPYPQRSTFSGWQVAACPEQGPGLAIGSNGVLHGVWYEASHGPNIWYGHLHPGHKPTHKLEIGGPGASHADVAVRGRTVWVVWNQVSAQGYALKLRVSHDDGDHFAAPRTLAQSQVAVYSPQLLLLRGKAYAGWNTLDGYRLVAIGAAR